MKLTYAMLFSYLVELTLLACFVIRGMLCWVCETQLNLPSLHLNQEPYSSLPHLLFSPNIFVS